MSYVNGTLPMLSLKFPKKIGVRNVCFHYRNSLLLYDFRVDRGGEYFLEVFHRTVLC